ncbi:MAG: hypothetical protein U1F36_05945 [Planctomycetota bacterium]
MRVVILSALAVTLVIAGPRAWRVIESRLSMQTAQAAARSPLVATDRLGSIDAPAWLRGEVLHALLEDFEPRLKGAVHLLDEAGALALQDRLRQSSWVRSAKLSRVYPDRFKVHIELRRPVARMVGDRGHGLRTLVLFDEQGFAMPAHEVPLTELPEITLDGATPSFDFAALRGGEPCADRRVIAACAVAAEWDAQVAPQVHDCPRLRAIDPRNLDYQFAADSAQYARILVGLQRSDGQVAWFHHGLASIHGGSVDPKTRASVLQKILELHPGLEGIESGDLRLSNLWRNYLVPGTTGVR